MPREMINRPAPFDPTGVSVNTPPVHGMAWPDPTVHVSWTRSSEQAEGRVQVFMGLPVDYLEYLMRDTVVEPSVDAYSPVFTREDVNKLIRTLRRARDAAYGRDE